MQVRSRLVHLLGPAVLFALVVCFFWKLVLTNQFTWMESPDTARLILPWFQFQAGEWHLHHFPLWDPSSWGGQPLFGQAQPGAAYPLNWVLFWMPLHDGWMRQIFLHWYYVLIHYLAALTAYWLARDLGRSRGASILAGCAYALGGYVASTDWPQMLNGAVWVPLVFLFLFRVERGHKPAASAALSGLFLGVMWLAGHHQIQIFVSLAVAGVWLYLCLRHARPNWKLARLAALSLIVAVLASGFQTIPTAEYGRVAQRWSGTGEPLKFNEVVPYNIHRQYALGPISILGIIIPGMIRGGGDPFMGVVGLSLGILGLALAWRERQVRWLAAVGLGGLLFALGPNSLLHGVMYAVVPLVEKARVPAAAILLFNLAVAALIAYGADHLAQPDSASWSRRASIALGSFGVFLLASVLLLQATHVPIWISDDRLVMTAIFSILLATLLSGWRAGRVTRATATGCLIGLVLFELANETGFWWPHVLEKDRNIYLKPMSQHADLVGYVRSRATASRIDYDSDEIKYNLGDWWGIETFEAYTASVLHDLWRNDIFSPRFQDFFGVQFYIGKKPSRPDQKDVFTGASGLKVFENPHPFPRVWAVHEAFQVASEEAARDTLADAAFDPRRRTFLLGSKPPDLGHCDGGDDDVELVRHESNRVTISANLSCRGMVILTDNYFPGWTATVDGKPAAIYEAYAVVRGVAVEAGKHTIEMRYRPRSVILGGVMTLAAMLFSVALVFRKR